MFAAKKNDTKTSASAKPANNAPFIQPKLNIGQPGDRYEQEADKVADQLMERSNDSSERFFPPSFGIEASQTAGSVPAKPVAESFSPLILKEEEEEEALQMKSGEDEALLQAQAGDDVSSPPEEPPRDKDLTYGGTIQKKEDAEEKIQTKPEEEEKEIQAKDGGGEVSSVFESSLDQSIGSGSPLPGGVKDQMESGFGTDFSGVRVHTGSEAVQMNREVGAQAFTHGNDIYFNEGKFDPGSQSGQHLIAHELTHTVQQGASVQPKLIQREEGETTAENPEDILKKFYLPAVKARHLQLYQTWASQGKLKRFQGYSRGRPNQISIWKNHFWDKMQNTEKLGLHEEFAGVKKIKTPGNKVIRGRRATLLKKLTIANWDKQGKVLDNTMEVDHIVELQTGGWPNSTVPNEIENMELLDKSSNAAAGSKTKSNIVTIVRNYLEAAGEPATQSDAERYMASNTINFEQVELGRNEFAGQSIRSKYWTREEIEQGQHLDKLKDLGNIGEPGTPTEFALMTPDDGYLMELFSHEEGALSIQIGPENAKSKAVAGMKISNISLNSGYEAIAPDLPIGTITANWDLPSEFNAPEGPFQVQIKKSVSQYGGKVGDVPSMGMNFEYLSPVELSGEFGVNDQGFYAEGRLTPSVEFLQGASLVVGVQGRDAYFNAEFSPSDLNLPIPGLTIDSSTLVVGYNTADGFGLEGDVEFRMDPIGEGSIRAGFNRRNGLSFRGDITFDERLFGRSQARARIAYENELWSVGGTLTIPRNKVPGIKTATISVDYSQESGLSATGDAELSIPGVEQGTLAINYGEEGFLISGEFDLSSDVPGIRGGHIEARVGKQEGEEGYELMVSGTAQPDIPGIDSTLMVSYENGALTIEGHASYERGMLSGQVDIGATNRTIGEDGQPGGEPDGTMRVYGGGSLTLTLTPWLQATAGVHFLPNGEIEVVGRIGLPNSVDIFPRKSFDRNLFTAPVVEIPIFAIPLGPRSIGLVARITGGLDFSAGFGPGQLRNLFAEVTYNPDHEDETQIHGHGEFVIPADAGLTLHGDLGLGVSIGIASLTGGIELAGTLGLEGEAAAAVDVNWSPQTGLALDAEGRITVNPKFTFDVNAFARASLDLWITSISETWRYNLASFSWGPDIQFGIVFPVHYREGEPFDISFDDIRVIYPNLNIPNLAKGLARDIKDDIFD